MAGEPKRQRVRRQVLIVGAVIFLIVLSYGLWTARLRAGNVVASEDIIRSVNNLPDCNECYHLPTDPSIYGHYAGTHCPCLKDGLVPNPRPFTLALPDTSEALASAPQLYLDLMKAVVLNTAYSPSLAAMDGSAHPMFELHLTMIGQRRLDNTQQLLQVVIAENIPGDFIETGTWRGGSAMFAAAVFRVYQQLGAATRWVWLADSFKGVPPVRPELYPADSAHQGVEKLSFSEHNSPQQVVASFKALGVYQEDAVRLLPGYFNETLSVPETQAQFAQRQFSLIRLDGDTYESTWQSLQSLYPHLAVGGFVVVDDYMDWSGARQATKDYRTKHGITSPIIPVYHENVRFAETPVHGEIPRGVWWRKTEAPGGG